MFGMTLLLDCMMKIKSFH